MSATGQGSALRQGATPGGDVAVIPIADRLRRGQHLTEIPVGPGRDRVLRLRGSPDSTNAGRREIGLTCREPVSAAELESCAMTVITEHEEEQISKANASGLAPVVFVHGLWLLPSSWDRWAAVFAEAGYAPLTPSWPDDPDTVEEANEHPEVFARNTVGQVADHYAAVISKLAKKPAVIGHSFRGLPSPRVARPALSAPSVAIPTPPTRAVP